jgi:hypothetical protein
MDICGYLDFITVLYTPDDRVGQAVELEWSPFRHEIDASGIA